MKPLRPIPFLTFTLTAAAAFAQSEGRGRPPKPPEEAFEACSGLEENASCNVKIGTRSITGTCHQGHEDKLFCMPAGGPPGGRPPSGSGNGDQRPPDDGPPSEQQ